MKRYIGPLMNTFSDLNNYRLSEQFINKVLEEQPVVPVTIQFNGTPIGNTLKFTKIDDQILCTFQVTQDRAEPFVNRSYIVAGLDNVEFHYEGRTKVIDKGDLNEISISLLPSNPHLKPFEDDKEEIDYE